MTEHAIPKELLHVVSDCASVNRCAVDDLGVEHTICVCHTLDLGKIKFYLIFTLLV